MKKTISLILGSLLALSLCFSAYAATETGERMVTKAELEAAGKGPDSVNWRYQEDYLANRPIPESALIYKPKASSSTSSTSSSSKSTYTPSSKGLLGDILSPISDPLTSTFDAIFGKGAAENYLKYGHV